MIDGLASPHCAKGRAQSRTGGLRMRAAPVDGEILGSLRKDEEVTVWAVENGWAIVQRADGLAGWTSLAYLIVLGELVP